MNRNVLGIVFALTLWGGVVLANDPIQDNSPHTLGQHSCQVTSSVLYYAGTSNIYPADIFDGSTNVHWRISVVPNDSWYSIYNNGLFNAPGFQFGSNGKPINQGPIIAVASTSPGSIGTSIPSGYTRAQIASQIVYRLKRRSYAAGPFPNPIYYTPVGGSTQNTTINTSPNASSTEQDNECRNMYVGFCGDTVVDSGTQSSFEGTPAQFANYGLAGGESCDDGNTNNNDACKNDCTWNTPSCGTVNGKVYYAFGDNGTALNQNSANLCPAGQVVTAWSWNQATHTFSWKCKYNAPGAPESVQCTATESRCGDNIVGTGINYTNQEICDDGNTNNNDACKNDCTRNAPTCGTANGKVYYAFGDNGTALNQNSANLCPAGQVVTAWSWNQATHTFSWKCKYNVPGAPESTQCTATESRCGDGVTGTGINYTNQEACDDGNTNNNDACKNDCTRNAPTCGTANGKVYYAFGDNGTALNQNSANLCPAGQVVTAWSWNQATHTFSWKCKYNVPGAPESAQCTATESRCGDNIVGTGINYTNQEACDDGNQNNNDSCNNNCQIPVGSCEGGANGQTYYDGTHPPLGDEINQNTPGLCAAGQQAVVGSFQYNTGAGTWTWKCEWPGGPDSPLCTANEDYCGDGVLNGTQTNPETCDDGNNISNDGCSATCVIETPGCGFANGQTYYGIFPGVSLDETSPDLCPTGQVVVPGSFDYNSPNYTWECDFPTGDNPVSCGALDSRCGDGIIGTGIGYTQFGNEQCDENGNNGVACTPGYGGTCTYCSLNCQEVTLTGGFCGDTLFQDPPEECDPTSSQNTCANGLTCMSDCSCEDMTLGSCGFANGKTYYAFGNNGAALNVNSPNLCPTGQTVTPGSFTFANGVFSWSCDGPGGTGPTCYASESRCGDDIIGTGINYVPGQEQCDEGANNGVPCTPGYGQTCTYCTTMCVEEEIVGPYCGDGIIQPGEQCDDGGIVNGDGCNQFCQIESPGACGGAYSGQYLYDANNSGDSISINTPGLCVGGVPTTFSYNPTTHTWTWTCPGNNGGNPVSCQAWELRCGNNDVDGNEECDGSNNTCGTGEICNQNSCQCVVEGNPECGYLLNVDQGYDFNGDNMGEEIDINTQVLCLEGTPVGFNYSPFARERRWHCVENGVYSNQCYFSAQRCGNGLVEDFLGVDNPEECDGGNGNTDIEHCDENELCVSCTCIPPAPVCGNGIVEAGEACDDGNGSNSDTCTNACEPTVCGDGITQSPNGMGQNEACDDGNQDDDDSCSNTCMVNEPSECTYLSVNYTPGDLPWIVPYNCVGNGNDVTVVLYNGQGVPIQTGYTAQGVFQLNSVDTYQIVCSYDGVTSPACQQTIEVGGYCEDLVAQGSGQTYTFSCDGVGSDFEIVITDAQGNIITTASSGSSFQYTYTFTQPGTYTAICYVDGQTGRSCPDSNGSTTGGPTTGGPTVTTIPLPTGGTNTGGPTVTTIPLPTGGTLTATPTPTTVLPTEGTNSGGPTVTTVSPTNGGSTTADSVPTVPVKPVGSTETHTHTHGSTSVGTVGTASPTQTTVVPTTTLGTETTKGKESTTTITVVEKFKTQSVILDKNTAIIDKNGSTVVVPSKSGTSGISPTTTLVGTVPTTTVGHGGGSIGNGGGVVVGGGGSVVGNGSGCFNPCQEVVVITVPSFCGDGVVDPGEQCDDGNDQNGDGCENDCTQTMGDSCHGDVDCFGWSMHFAHPLLSDAIIELYDASNTILLGQGFAPQNNNPSTTVTGARLVMPQPGSQINRQIQYMGGIKTLTSTMPTDCYSCGNGLLDPGEECDGAAGGCGNGLVCNTAVCLCVSEPNNGVCGTTNGDIIYDLDNNGDALNENSPGLCLFGTVTGFVYNTTTNQRTWECVGQNGGENDTCSAQELYCGNGSIDANSLETCDDGNTVNGDGCSSICEIETVQCPDPITNFTVNYPVAPVINVVSDTVLTLSGTVGGNVSSVVVIVGSQMYPATLLNGVREATVSLPVGISNIRVKAMHSSGDMSCNGVLDLIFDVYIPYCGNNLLDPGEECDGAAGGCGNGLVCNTAVCLCVSEPNNGVCGTTNGDIIYDLDNNGDALNENSPGLCLFGTVTGFVYNTTTNQRTWECVGQNGGENDTCSAQELYCGNGSIDANSLETCDDGNTVNGDGCSSICEIETVQCLDPITNFTVNYPVAPVINVVSDTVLTLSGTVGGNVSSVVVIVGSQMYPATLLNGVREATVSLPVGISNIRVKAMHSSGDMSCNGVLDLIFDVQVPYCGDGIIQSGEECDDGNTNNADQCSSQCAYTYCGDGIQQNPNGNSENEWCDDGNTNNTDGCTTRCMETYCGDGIVQTPNAQGQTELCDDGNTNNADGCTNTCQPSPLCGNDVIDPGEGCDDGNLTIGDGCNSSCQDEYCGDLYWDIDGGDNLTGTTDDEACEQNSDCPIPSSICVSGCLCVVPVATYCGDGEVQTPNSAGQYEQCDDGNTANGDGCESNCTLTIPSVCQSLELAIVSQNAPTSIAYSCVGTGEQVFVQLFGSNGGLVASAQTAQGTFSIVTPDQYTVICSYDGITSVLCEETIDIGGYCEDLTSAATTGQTYNFTCSGVGDNYLLVISNNQQQVVATASATGDFTYTYTFASSGTYTAICFVDGISNATCADAPVTGFTTQSLQSSLLGGSQPQVVVVASSPTTKVVHAQTVDYLAQGFTPVASLAPLLQQQAVVKQASNLLLSPSTLQSISVGNTQSAVVIQPFYAKVAQVEEAVTQQLTTNCYNNCLETITIHDPDVPVCTLVTDPQTTVKQGSALTVTGTCLYTGMQGVPSIDCGNGQVVSGATGACAYTGKNSWTMGCMLDAQAVSGCNQLVKLTSGGGGSSILCGNGKLDPGEHCDDGNTVNGDACPASCRKGGGDPSSIDCGNGKIDPGEVCDDGIKNGLKSVCTTSCTLKGITPVVQGDTVPKCSFIDPPSIQLGELLPYWREVEDDEDIIDSASCGADSEGKIPEDSLRCYFTVEAPDGTKYKLDELCTSKKLMSVGWYNDLQKDLGMTLSSQRGQSYVDTSTWSSKVFGEYTISLDKITYAVCTETAPASATQPASYAMAYNQSYEGRVCQFNFAVTTPYLVQKGTALSSLVDDIEKLKNFLRIDGRSILDVSDIVLLEKTSVSDAFATMKKAVYKAADKAVQKLDVSHPLGAIDSGFKKVPNQELYVIENGFTLRHYGSVNGFNGGKPTTIVVRGAVDVAIVGSLPGNILIVAPEGTVTFVNQDCDITDKIEATIVAAKINAKLAVNNANSSTTSSEWCTDGKLVIRGVLVSEQQGSIEGIRAMRRSTLNDWFDGESSKSEHIYAGASLRIESRPGVWSTQPPLAANNNLFFRTQSHGSAEEEVIVLLPLELLEVLLPLFQ